MDDKSLVQNYGRQFQCGATYIFVFEILRRFIIQRVQGFFSNCQADEAGKARIVVDIEYREPKNKIFSKCKGFLVEIGIIDETESVFLNKCRLTRNKMAHNLDEEMLNQFLFGFQKEVDIMVEEINQMRNMLVKITNGWINNFESWGIDYSEDKIRSPLVGFMDMGIESLSR